MPATTLPNRAGGISEWHVPDCTTLQQTAEFRTTGPTHNPSSVVQEPGHHRHASVAASRTPSRHASQRSLASQTFSSRHLVSARPVCLLAAGCLGDRHTAPAVHRRIGMGAVWRHEPPSIDLRARVQFRLFAGDRPDHPCSHAGQPRPQGTQGRCTCSTAAAASAVGGSQHGTRLQSPRGHWNIWTGSASPSSSSGSSSC